MTLQQVAQAVLYAIGGLISSIIMAVSRNFMATKVVNGGFVVAASPFGAVALSMQVLHVGAARFSAFLQKGLSKDPDNINFWDISGPLLFTAFFGVLIAGDAYFAILTLPELFGTAQPNINPNLFAPVSAILWVTISLALVTAASDLFGMTHLLRPFSNAPDRVRPALQIAISIALGLLVITAVLFGLFRALLVHLISVGFVDVTLSVLFLFLAIIATVISGIAVPFGIVAVGLVLTSIVGLASRVLSITCNVPIVVLDRVADVAVGAYDVPAHLGRAIWNWIAQLSEGKPWQMGTIAAEDKRDRLQDIMQDFLSFFEDRQD